MAYRLDYASPPALFVEPLYAPTTDGLISWLKCCDPKATYNWWDVHNCLLCQFAVACGYTADDWIHFHHFFGIGCLQPWTYGAALKRARELKRI